MPPAAESPMGMPTDGDLHVRDALRGAVQPVELRVVRRPNPGRFPALETPGPAATPSEQPAIKRSARSCAREAGAATPARTPASTHPAPRPHTQWRTPTDLRHQGRPHSRAGQRRACAPQHGAASTPSHTNTCRSVHDDARTLTWARRHCKRACPTPGCHGQDKPWVRILGGQLSLWDAAKFGRRWPTRNFGRPGFGPKMHSKGPPMLRRSGSPDAESYLGTSNIAIAQFRTQQTNRMTIELRALRAHFQARSSGKPQATPLRSLGARRVSLSIYRRMLTDQC